VIHLFKMATKFDPRSVKIQFLSEVAHYLLHLYNGAPQLPGERVTSDDEENRQYVWYRFVRNRDYNQLERTSPNPDSCLNDIITENYPLLLPAFGAQSRVGEHAFGVSEDKTYHHYFLLLPPKDELVLDDDSKGSPDKFLRKLVKRAQAFLKQFANGPPPPPPTDVTTATVTAAAAAVAPPPLQSQLVPPLRSAVAAAPTQPTQPAAATNATTTTTTTTTNTTTTNNNSSDVVLAAVKRDRTAMEQAAQDQAELKALKTDELAVKRARLAEEAKRKAEAKAQRERDEQERAAKAEADELARIAAEQERLEKERQARIAECPFPKRAPGTVGFVQAPFQTADGLVVNPWFLL